MTTYLLQLTFQIGVATLLVWILFRLRYYRILKAASNLPPAVPTSPLFGHLHTLCIRGLVDGSNSLIQNGRASLEKGIRNSIFWFGPYPIFFVINADDIHLVLTSSKTAEKGVAFKLVKFALGNGLLTASGEAHRVTRRHLNPLFQPRNLRQLLPAFNASGRHLVRDLSERVGAGLVDVQPACDKLAVISICGIIFGSGVKIDPKSEECKILKNIGKRIAKLLLNRVVKFWLWPDPIFKYLWRKEINDVHNGWKSFTDKLMQEKNSSLENKFGHDEHTVTDTDAASKLLPLPEIYRVLQEKYPQINDDDLLQQMLTLVIAGADTSKISIASCLLSLAACPDIQERLYEEIVSVLGTEEEDRDLTIEDLNEMHYLDQVFKETLRKYHVIPFILRSVNEDIELSDVTVPKGSTIGVVLYGLHFNPDVYPNPEQFDPDRFSTENIDRTRKHYLPFSFGARNCIGSLYAAILFKMAVVYVVRRFRLSSDEDITRLRYKGAMAMVTESGYKMHVSRREEGNNKNNTCEQEKKTAY